ncbi:hypothetical protein GSI_12634 [Ganoderma sinense ZZ0214-1]|uniref:Transporter n=1 Tax=Ganoderma sinense ZZ0214-1 TaxID=1077348 RepID=A0A2G8RTT4_9APHY|nr:hypothetical protein GSI_12634 [Ganoderma sinense ZZ0214-1]
MLQWATLLFNVIGYYDVAQAYAAQLQCQCTTDEAVPIIAISPGTPSCSLSGFGLPGAIHGLTVCAPTIILTFNVVLGDAIVWWRVWAIWPRSLVVRGSCIILLAATLGSGIIDSMDSCPKAAFSVLVVSNLTDIPTGSFYQSDLFGLAASVLSLANNMVATILIGCKAWEHREIMIKASLDRKGQVQKVLIFLVESGAIYCLIWVSILVQQVAILMDTGEVSPSEPKALTQFDYFVKGCLIPLIGMYPTTIITLVALNKSHFHEAPSNSGTLSNLSFRYPTSEASTHGEGRDGWGK